MFLESVQTTVPMRRTSEVEAAASSAPILLACPYVIFNRAYLLGGAKKNGNTQYDRRRSHRRSARSHRRRSHRRRPHRRR